MAQNLAVRHPHHGLPLVFALRRVAEKHGDRFIGPEQERVAVGELLNSFTLDIERRGAKSLHSVRSNVATIRAFFGDSRAVDEMTTKRGTSLSMLEVMADAYKVLQLKGQHLNPWRAFYLATLGGAEALCLDDWIGNFAAGKEADFTVLDFDAIPILKHRSEIAHDFAERLFALMILGDDRTVAATYVLGEAAFSKAQ